MWSIPAPQRPIGQAYLVVAMHALGDVPSPPIVGALQGGASTSMHKDAFLHKQCNVGLLGQDAIRLAKDNLSEKAGMLPVVLQRKQLPASCDLSACLQNAPIFFVWRRMDSQLALQPSSDNPDSADICCTVRLELDTCQACP